MEYNSLTHHGIRGMKWGVRRYQRKDGSLTPEGKKRYSEEGSSEKSNKSGGNSGTEKNNKTKKTSSSNKKLSDMSDEELQRVVKRLQLEQQYNKLNPQKVSLGKKFVDHVAKNIVAPTMTNIAKDVLEKEIRKQLTKR